MTQLWDPAIIFYIFPTICLEREARKLANRKESVGSGQQSIEYEPAVCPGD